MELTKSQVEQLIQKKAKKSKILIFITLSIIVFISIINVKNNDIDLGWFIYFFLLELLCMPTLFNCSKDLRDYKNNKLILIQGQVIDLFAEDENKKDGNWILILTSDNVKGEVDYILPSKPEIKVNDFVSISHTKILNIPIKIEKITA